MNDQDINIDEIYQAYLAKVYQHAESYLSFSKAEHDKFVEACISFTYGEMLYPSIKKLLSQLDLTAKDVFLDLGSGLGKFALQVFMQTNVSKVIGVEAVTVLNDQALRAEMDVKAEFPNFWDNNRSLEFINGNFLTTNWDKANIVYSCSTCFRQELLNAIGDKVNHEDHVEHVFTLRPLPTLTRLFLKQVFTVECTWDTALCYHYTI